MKIPTIKQIIVTGAPSSLCEGGRRRLLGKHADEDCTHLGYCPLGPADSIFLSALGLGILGVMFVLV